MTNGELFAKQSNKFSDIITSMFGQRSYEIFYCGTKIGTVWDADDPRDAITQWLDEESDNKLVEPLLSAKEHKYLENFIHLFRSTVRDITKYRQSKDEECLNITYYEHGSILTITLPNFYANSMYSKLRENHHYTLDELNL